MLGSVVGEEFTCRHKTPGQVDDRFASVLRVAQVFHRRFAFIFRWRARKRGEEQLPHQFPITTAMSEISGDSHSEAIQERIVREE